MAKSRPHFLSEDVLSSAQAAVSSREWEGPARWTEYLGPELASRNKNRDQCTTPQSHSGSSLKGFNMQWKHQILDYPDSVGHVYSKAFWKAGVFPNQPKIGILLDMKFPEHHSNLQLERELRKDWLSVLIIVTSARSSINIRHLEKTAVSTGKEGLLSEGNDAYNWSRCLHFL